MKAALQTRFQSETRNKANIGVQIGLISKRENKRDVP